MKAHYYLFLLLFWHSIYGLRAQRAAECETIELQLKQNNSALQQLYSRLEKNRSQLAVTDKNLKTAQEALANLEKVKQAIEKGSLQAGMLESLMGDMTKTESSYKQEKKDLLRLIEMDVTEEKKLRGEIRLGEQRVKQFCGPVSSTLKLIVKVMDAATNKALTTATVSVKNQAGASFAASGTRNVKGEYLVTVGNANRESSLRVIASAAGYQEKWSDVTAELLQQGERLFTIYLEKKKPAASNDEVKYGPFNVGLGAWVATGVRIAKGGSYRVTVTGKITYTDAYKVVQEMSADGHGYWNFFVLKGKLGNEIVNIGSSGGGYAKEDGMLELGAPRVNVFYPEDGAGTSGQWSVTVYARKATLTGNSGSGGAAKAQEHLDFLRKLRSGQVLGQRDNEEITQELKFIINEYQLNGIKNQYNLEDEFANVRLYYSSFGNPMPSVKSRHEGFLDALIKAIESGTGK